MGFFSCDNKSSLNIGFSFDIESNKFVLLLTKSCYYIASLLYIGHILKNISRQLYFIILLNVAQVAVTISCKQCAI